MGMKPVTLKTIADVTGGKLVGGGEDTLITGVVRDNREVKEGFLFVCFPGARVDGHDFAPDAFSKGAAACQSLPQRRQNSKAKMGRRRFPPARRLYSMASKRIFWGMS